MAGLSVGPPDSRAPLTRTRAGIQQGPRCWHPVLMRKKPSWASRKSNPAIFIAVRVPQRRRDASAGPQGAGAGRRNTRRAAEALPAHGSGPSAAAPPRPHALLGGAVCGPAPSCRPVQPRRQLCLFPQVLGSPGALGEARGRPRADPLSFPTPAPRSGNSAGKAAPPSLLPPPRRGPGRCPGSLCRTSCLGLLGARARSRLCGSGRPFSGSQCEPADAR